MAIQPIAPIDSPPPDLPNMPDVSDTLSRYLRTFSLWCRHGFRDKLSATTALPGVMFQAYDATPGTVPLTYTFGVTQGGKATLAPIAAGSAQVGTPVPIGAGDYLPLGGGSLNGFLDVQGAVSIHANAASGNNAYVGFHDASGARHGYVGLVGDPCLVSDTTGGAIHLSNDGYTRFNGGVMLPSDYGWIAMPGGYSHINVVSTGANDAFITFLSPSAYGVNVGLNQNGYFYRGGWSDGNAYYNFWTSREWNPPCDYRMKKNVEPLASTWDAIKKLTPVKYQQKKFVSERGGQPLSEDDDREHWGFVAHELQEVLGDTAAYSKKDHPDILQIPNMNMLVAALVRTVQELQARVEELEAR